MEVLAFVLSSGVAAVGGAFLIGTFVWLAKQRGSAGPPSQIAAAAGLVATSPTEAHGERDGVRVAVRWATERRGSGKQTRTVRVMRYTAALEPPLRMGLGLGEQQLVDPFFQSIGFGSDITIHHPALDSAFVIAAHDPQHVQALLFDAQVSDALLVAREAGRLAVDDAQVRLGHDGWESTAAGLGARVAVVFRLAVALRQARLRHRAPWEASVDASWGATAGLEGLRYDASSTRLGGSIEGAWVQVEVVTTNDGIATSAWARFPTPLELGLHVYRSGLGDKLGAMFGGQDVRCGHAAFDDAFVVKSTLPEAARALLGGGGAEAIVTLATLSHDVFANDEGLRVTVPTLITDGPTLTRLVSALRDAARSFAGGGTASRGAYR